MFFVPQKKASTVLITLSVLCIVALIGCGGSQGVQTLSSCLTDLSQLVDNYKTSVGSDESNQAEWDAKIAAMTEKWTDTRNELSDDVTPQEMEKMVQKYDALMAILADFKKTIGS